MTSCTCARYNVININIISLHYSLIQKPTASRETKKKLAKHHPCYANAQQYLQLFQGQFGGVSAFGDIKRPELKATCMYVHLSIHLAGLNTSLEPAPHTYVCTLGSFSSPAYTHLFRWIGGCDQIISQPGGVSNKTSKRASRNSGCFGG